MLPSLALLKSLVVKVILAWDLPVSIAPCSSGCFFFQRQKVSGRTLRKAAISQSAEQKIWANAFTSSKIAFLNLSGRPLIYVFSIANPIYLT